MTNPLTTSREALAADVSTRVGPDVRVYPYPVESPTPPCIEVVPSTSDWVVQRLNGSTVSVAWDLRVAVAYAAGAEKAGRRMDDIAWALISSIAAAPVESTRFDTVGQVDCITQRLTVRMKAKAEETP